jgi:transcriptional regulator of acetoin/glycerol metabolism
VCLRKELQSALDLARAMPPEELPEFLGQLETIRIVGLARISAPAVAIEDKQISITEAAPRLGVSRSFLYRHWKKYKFARQEGTRVLFSSAGLDSHVRRAR